LPRFGLKTKKEKKMEINFYEQQMNRLKEQWPNAYSKERMKVIFNAFRDVPNFDFRDAITHCLGNSKGSPLLPELIEAVNKTRSIRLQKERIDEEAAFGALDYAAKNNTTADREFVNQCLKLYDDLITKKITKKQFDEGCDLLDQAAKLFRNKKPTVVEPKLLSKPYKDDEDHNEPKPY
jgi:hypothetical protein